MQTKFMKGHTPDPGDTVALLSDGQFNDPTDVAAGNTVASGTFRMGQGTSGMVIFVNVSAVGAPAGVINRIDVRALVAGVRKIVHTFANLNLNAVKLYAFEIAPAAVQAGYDGVIQAIAPNQGDILLTLNNKDDFSQGSVSVQSEWGS